MSSYTTLAKAIRDKHSSLFWSVASILYWLPNRNIYTTFDKISKDKRSSLFCAEFKKV